jgi:hypothetical protein
MAPGTGDDPPETRRDDLGRSGALNRDASGRDDDGTLNWQDDDSALNRAPMRIAPSRVPRHQTYHGLTPSSRDVIVFAIILITLIAVGFYVNGQ